MTVPGSRVEEVTLTANEQAPSAARRFVRGVLDGWRLDTADTVLATSEAVAQAVLHAVTERITVSVRNRGGGRIRVEVSDDDHRPRDLRDPTTRFSLVVLQSIADDWGVTQIESDGEVTWFEIDARRRPI